MEYSKLQEKFGQNTRVIVYGAGENGTKVYELLRNSCNVVLWCDANWKKIGSPVGDPALISDTDHDIILITISNHEIVGKIREFLIKIGVLPEKIIVANGCPDDYIEEYENTAPLYWSDDHNTFSLDKPYAVTSMICNQSLFDMPFFRFWSEKVYDNFVDLMKATDQLSERNYKEQVTYHRKLWEFVYISQALYERGMLSQGKKGVVFGAGTECLPDLFASYGCHILATDLSFDDASEKGWVDSAQNAAGVLSKFNQYHFCDETEFYERVSYRDVDMNDIPKDIEGYDFCWSACALEHLGSLQKGLEFIKNSLKTLKSGGIAVHTTEYNLTSNDQTIDGEGLVLYRKKDIESLIRELEEAGNYVYPMDWHVGNNVLDNFVDLPPFSHKDMHLRLVKEEYATTSIGIIIRKAET